MRIIFKFFLVLVAMLSSCLLQATAQSPDYLVFNGKTVSMNSNPLERYFENYPDKRPKGGVISTGCWRGYVATFELRDGRFFVKKIVIEVADPKAGPKEFKTIEKDVTNTVFHNPNELFCDWYTAAVVLPEGDVVNYVHMGYGSTFERYTLVNITKGIQTNTRKFSAKEFLEYRKVQFAAYKKTPEYKAEMAECLKDGGKEEEFERFLFEYASEYYLTQDFNPSKN
jgi:hypothetical protein